MYRTYVRVAATLLILAWSGASAEAQPCARNDVMDRCSPEQHARMLELYGMPPIDAHQEAGDRVRRAFYVDGYDNDVVAISFIRTRGREPIVSVHLPRREGQRFEPLVTSVPEDVWNDALRRSRLFERTLEPLSKVDPGTELICLHAWIWTVEATDPPGPDGQPNGVRRRTDNGCDDGLAGRYADELAVSARSLLSYCRGLDLRRSRGEASLLAECFKLRGDRNAAAAVRNRVEAFLDASILQQPLGLTWLFGDVTIELAGERRRPERAEQTWLERVWGDMSRAAYLFVDVVEAESSTRATVVGRLSRNWPRNPADPNSELRSEVARVEMTWVSQWDEFFLERIAVGPFEEELRR